MTHSNLQNNLWQQQGGRTRVAELCNVLYDRELRRLSQDKTMSLELLQKKLSSLTYYIERAAFHIIQSNTPLELDSTNASWMSKQSRLPLSVKAVPETTAAFYREHAVMALTVPIAIDMFGIEQVMLDSIDEVDIEKQTIHCNQHGWFNFDGTGLNADSNTKKVLLKPAKVTLSAGCCGHQWKNQHLMVSRALSLRELLLATRINWQRFSKPLPGYRPKKS